ncbi:MAG: histidine kinase [Mucilaginibacter sp.]|uniref:sensor histidine kinase n=1 Tax=Mucilaginibacter sp. TaxID=1882438 RepID=UPI0031A2A6B8
MVKEVLERVNTINKKLIYSHIAGWLIFIVYEQTAVYFISHRSTPFLDNFLHYSLYILLFYCNYLIFSIYAPPKFFRLPLIIGIITELIVYFVLSFSINVILAKAHIATTWSAGNISGFVAAIIWRAIYFILLSTGYWLGIYLYHTRAHNDKLIQQQLTIDNQNLELQKQVVIAENAYLKAQINPHLLFNSLNFVYNTIYKVSEKAADAVILLSEITRYSLQKLDARGEQKLNDEINQVKNVIKLNQIRFKDQLQIQLTTKDIPEYFRIPPLVLITFIENIFKYGDLYDAAKPATINMWATDGTFHFCSVNRFTEKKKTISHGIGLNNVRLRLQSAYPDKHHLHITSKDNIFTVELAIQMNYAEELYS